MNRTRALVVFAYFIFFLKPFSVFSQKSKGGIPLSISHKIKLENPVIDIAGIQPIKTDEPAFGNTRIAKPIPVDFDNVNAGMWTALPTGERLWQLRLKSKGALGLALIFSKMKLPEGAKLYVYTPDGKQIMGAYDAENINEDGQLMVGITRGEETVIEYIEPKSVQFNGRFSISTVFHVYSQDGLAISGFGDALSCQTNINCTTGANWQDSKKGVVRILIAANEGLFWCSGSLINNTKQDGTPYLLSAYHCSDGMTPQYNLWTFYFNYESPTCNNPATEPSFQSLQGCTLKSGSKASDFQLLELTQRPPTNYNAFYNGWNRDSSSFPTSAATIHHPWGDIKKISIDNNALVANSGSNAVLAHRQFLLSTLDEGSTEPGSSGAPLFDQNKRIVGQLFGTFQTQTTDCTNFPAIFGWFAKSWDGGGTAQTRLKDWLDPLSTGAMNMNGSETPSQARGTIAGKISQWTGTAMAGVKVVIGTDSTMTDNNGNFSIPNIALNSAVTVKITKTNDAVDNGVDAGDMLLMRRYLLGSHNFTSPFSLLAGDVDDGGDIDAADILLIRRMLLGIILKLPKDPTWRFVSVQTASRPDFPSVIDPVTLSVTFTGNVSNFNFYGFRAGDVNGSAD
jgi:hypothetical protein